ncbi:Kinesin-associated protein 3 [Amphibalanus amphitrite]|uniref:Kinesin-associated protein 3 n=1 Tax=Amphibalanus amphitrite TaxID=1232801 RepID=A0A6A4WPK3_AMPAM|nr:Kinesin-associated protein 3 [Amphibalanus amphitrite]
MQSEDAKYLKKRVKTGSIDVHPTEKALLVNYELEATILGELGDPMLGDKKECQKIIRLTSLSAETNVAQLAREVMARCQLIPPSRQPELEQAIFYLQHRRPPRGGETRQQSAAPGPSRPDSAASSPEPAELAQLTDVDSYVELLYEELSEKERGAQLLLQLARNPDNLDELVNNEAMIGALSRTLREEWKKSTALATSIVYIFFCMSTFSQFHGIIVKQKMGSLCMDIVDHELKRYAQWREDLARRKRAASEAEFQQARVTLVRLVKKQNQLLRVCLYLLLNLAEDVKTEEKMRRRGVVPLLCRCLDRDSADLLLLVVTFLKKLSVYVENKDDMLDLSVCERLSPLVPHDNADLLNVTIRLLLNLSFDAKHRAQMVNVGLLPKLVNLIPSPRQRSAAIAVLYHLSMDDKVKSMFAYTDCIPICMKLVLEWPEPKVGLELMALCINLTANKRNAELVCEGDGLPLLVARAFQHQDPLVMKMVRNISQHEGQTKVLFLEFLGEFAESLHSCSEEEFVVETVGVLGNLSIPDLDFDRLFRQFRLVDWMKSKLTSGSCEDDLLLEVVVLMGTACADEACSLLLAEAGLLPPLVDLLNAKQEDDEMVLQIIYVFHQLTAHPSTRQLIIRDTHAPAYLVDLLHDKNAQIRRVCDATLDLIAEADPAWATRIRLEKFRWHNSQWLDMVETQPAEEVTAYDTDGEPFLHERDVLYQSDTSSEVLLDDDSSTHVRFDVLE